MRKKIKRALVYYLVRIFIWFFNIIPRFIAVFLGSILGYLVYFISRRDRIKARRNLNAALGKMLESRQQKTIVRSMFVNFGKNLADVIRFKNYYESQIHSLVDVEGQEYFDRAYNKGKGVIAITGHIGNFELLAAFMVKSGYKSAVIGREMYDKRLDEFLVGNREALGLVNIDTKESPRRIIKLLRDGYALGVLIDTDSIRVRGDFVPAFGRLSYTPTGQSIIGLKTGAAFVPMACVRNGKRYKIIIKPEVTIDRSDNLDDDTYKITKECTAVLENVVRDYPDQWVWLHNRWHTRPETPIN